ncbi:MAG TPA: MarR family winged helix-turn-helix transcriptional regulator [Actinomycetes bacterium]|nr:MarR family winged helix-turn-helix transcriptional regulator [Actinomycetes bacterium]
MSSTAVNGPSVRGAALTASLLGAVADELASAMDHAVQADTGLRGESSAALTVLLHTPGLTIKELARHLGMRSPSAVELVGRLEAQGLVVRKPGSDARSRSLVLSSAGRRRAQAVLAARDRVARNWLRALSPRQQRDVRGALMRILEELRTDDVDPDHLCRRCNESVCTLSICPVAR